MPITEYGSGLIAGKVALGIATGPSEAKTFWTDFLRLLADRGLRGVKLVIADDRKGLRAVARRVFSPTHQRCRVHWMRNALAHAAAKQRAAVPALPKTIFAQESKADAEAQWETAADALREKVEKLGTFMDDSRDDVLAYMDFLRTAYRVDPNPGNPPRPSTPSGQSHPQRATALDAALRDGRRDPNGAGSLRS